MTTSTSTLSDLTELTSHYLQTEVEVRVADVTRNLNPRAEGTYTVKVRNADAPRGIRLHDVTVHIKASSDVAQLQRQRADHVGDPCRRQPVRAPVAR